MPQPPSLPPSGGSPEIQAQNELTLQIYQLNVNLEALNSNTQSIFAFDPVLAHQLFLHLLYVFLVGFVIGAISSLIRRIRS